MNTFREYIGRLDLELNSQELNNISDSILDIEEEHKNKKHEFFSEVLQERYFLTNEQIYKILEYFN